MVEVVEIMILASIQKPILIDRIGRRTHAPSSLKLLWPSEDSDNPRAASRQLSAFFSPHPILIPKLKSLLDSRTLKCQRLWLFSARSLE